MVQFVKSLFARKNPEPSYPILPQVESDGQSNIPGIYVVGELAGTPLDYSTILPAVPFIRFMTTQPLSHRCR